MAAGIDDAGRRLTEASAYIASKDYDKAIAALTSVIHAEPGNSEAYFLRGVAYSKKGDQANSENDMKTSASLRKARNDSCKKPKNGTSSALRKCVLTFYLLLSMAVVTCVFMVLPLPQLYLLTILTAGLQNLRTAKDSGRDRRIRFSRALTTASAAIYSLALPVLYLANALSHLDDWVAALLLIVDFICVLYSEFAVLASRVSA